MTRSIIVIACLAATAFCFLEPQSLAESPIHIDFNSSLPCGACLRGGYSYCNST